MSISAQRNVTPEQAQAWANEVALRLRKLIRPRLRTMFLGYLTELQLHLLTAILSTRSDEDERERQNLLRSLKQQIVGWTDGFVSLVEDRLLEAGSSAGPADSSGRTGVGTSELVSFAKALLRAETQYYKVMTEIDARLNRIQLVAKLPIVARSLAPTGLHTALVQTAETMQWPSHGRAALLSCFDRHFIPHLEGLYTKLLTGLKVIEQESAGMRVVAQVQAASAQAPEKDQWMHPPRDMRNVDSDTVAMLKALAQEVSGDGYNDGLLASDLLAVVEQRGLAGLQQEKAGHSLQRARLAGHFFNEIKADPMVSDEAKQRHETLRMPLLKSAIADATVFTDASHPISSLIDDLLTRSAAQRLMGNHSEEEKIANSVHQTLALFDLAPDFVRESMEKAQPLGEEEIKKFYAMQRDQAARRREFVLSEAKRIVAQEIERSTFGCDVPPTADRFLRKAWCVLLTQRLLKHGAFHPSWAKGIEKVDQLVELLNNRDPRTAPPEEWRLLTSTMGAELLAMGLPQDQLGKVLLMLESAWTWRG